MLITEAVEKMSFILFNGQASWMESSFSIFLNFFLALLGLFRLVALYKLTARNLHHCFQEVCRVYLPLVLLEAIEFCVFSISH